MDDKFTYHRIITSLIGIILLMAMFIIIRPPQTQTIEVIKEVEVEVEKEVEVIVEVEKEVIVEVETTYMYNVTSVEREMLARLVYLEANTESLECQMAVVSVVINRWYNGQWGDTLEDVVYAEYQFAPASLIYRTTPTELNYTAVDLVLKNGCTMPSYCMYFRADYGFNWNGYKHYTQIGTTYFGYFEKDVK